MLRTPSCLRFAHAIAGTHAKLGYHSRATGFMGQSLTDSDAIQLHGARLVNSQNLKNSGYYSFIICHGFSREGSLWENPWQGKEIDDINFNSNK